MKTIKRPAIFLCMAFWPSLFSFGDRAAAVENQIRVKPGEFIVDHPTLINLGFEWVIEGDDNRNARVDVSYRKQGDTQWKQGLPLLRLQGERIYQNQGVFDVRPQTRLFVLGCVLLASQFAFGQTLARSVERLASPLALLLLAQP